MSMKDIAVKIVFAQKMRGSGPQSLEVIANQGVTFDQEGSQVFLIDIATRETIARFWRKPGSIRRTWSVKDETEYSEVFFHGVSPS